MSALVRGSLVRCENGHISLPGMPDIAGIYPSDDAARDAIEAWAIEAASRTGRGLHWVVVPFDGMALARSYASAIDRGHSKEARELREQIEAAYPRNGIPAEVRAAMVQS